MKPQYIHKSLAEGRWQELDLVEQLANIGAEVGRALRWQKEGRKEYSEEAFWRAIELLDLTKADPKNKSRLKELCYLKEFLGDYFVGENDYQSSPEDFEKYFNFFNYLAQKRRGR